MPNETNLFTKKELFEKICCILGGVCSEKIFFDKITNGASNDLEKAYNIARDMVIKYGMYKEIGFVAFKED